ncbi:hypothetical protein ACUXAU_002184 [Staphylococcus caprae]
MFTDKQEITTRNFEVNVGEWDGDEEEQQQVIDIVGEEHPNRLFNIDNVPLED